MARYKYFDTNPKFLPVDLARQLLPGTFEHALDHLLDHALDLSPFDARFRNDGTGAPAYPPAVLLKVVLFAYARGIVSSRAIARACTEHVTFIALYGDQAPHFTTIAHFVSTRGDEIAPVFAAVVAICDRQGLIGREMFAIDGVKLPSKASKQRSGTRAEFVRQAEKLERAAQVIVQRRRATDALPVEPPLAAKEAQRVAQLQHDAAELRAWLAAHPDERRGPTGGVRQSNRTDNDSAKMATGKGVIQGYTGVAAVDDRSQIIVVAQAHGTGSEHWVLLPVVDALTPRRVGVRPTAMTASTRMRARTDTATGRARHERHIGLNPNETRRPNDRRRAPSPQRIKFAGSAHPQTPFSTASTPPDSSCVVLAQESLVRRVGRVRLSGRIRILLHAVKGQRTDRGAEGGIEVGVLDPAVGVEEKVPRPPLRQ
jgi:transposase